eukprot:6182281-Prymnesium_polylepis.1
MPDAPHRAIVRRGVLRLGLWYSARTQQVDSHLQLRRVRHHPLQCAAGSAGVSAIWPLRKQVVLLST